MRTSESNTTLNTSADFKSRRHWCGYDFFRVCVRLLEEQVHDLKKVAYGGRPQANSKFWAMLENLVHFIMVVLIIWI